jgi:hypothetical protein
LDVVYSKPIAIGETISFTLCYQDPLKRTTIQPALTAAAIFEVEPRPGPVGGTLVTPLMVRDTVNGPLLDWATVGLIYVIYVVEYSDDAGVTWFSAVHRLGSPGTRFNWVDRGQPETWSKPVNKAARMYRVQRL